MMPVDPLLLELVARGICAETWACKHGGATPDSIDVGGQPMWRTYLDYARGALAALPPMSFPPIATTPPVVPFDIDQTHTLSLSV